MGAYPLNSKPTNHVRSISLPARPHPLNLQYIHHLNRLNAAHTASCLSPSSSSEKLRALGDLYEASHALLLLPLNQQELSAATRSRLIDQALERSIALLDVVGATKDALAQTRENAQALQSLLRRKREEGFRETSVVAEFSATRMKIKKLFQVFKNAVKVTERRFSTSINEGQTSVSIARIFRDIETATVSVLQFTLVDIYGTEVHSKPRRWSWISKFLQSKHMAFEETVLTNCEEFKMVSTVHGIAKQVYKPGKEGNVQINNVLRNLEKLESTIEDDEENFDRLARNLIQIRVSVLNALML